jgi:hypothetical protein
MSWRSLIVAVSVTAALLSGALSAAPASGQVDYQPVGALDYVWTGVTSRGCAAAGLCGVTGSLQVTPDGDEGGGSGQPSVDVGDENAVVRVEYPALTGLPKRVCVDPMPYDVTFALARRHGRNASPVGVGEAFNDVSAGQCAGPTATDLGRVRLPVRKERNGDYDLSGSPSFGAGPFKVTVISKLRVLVSRVNFPGFSNPPFPRPRPGSFPQPRRVLAEEAHVSYRISGVSGAISDSFSGLPAPLCAGLGACGTSGSVRVALATIRQMLVLSGERIVAHRVSGARALRDLRAGRLGLFDNTYELAPTGSVTESDSGPGSTMCSDALTNPGPRFFSTGTRTADKIYLDPNGVNDVFGDPEPLRTRCPGPSTETIAPGAVAAGIVRASELGAPRIRLVLRNRGRFEGVGYRGTRSGAIELTLIRTKVTAGTVRAKAIQGQLL